MVITALEPVVQVVVIVAVSVRSCDAWATIPSYVPKLKSVLLMVQDVPTLAETVKFAVASA
jgi:hypothetical protein